VALGEKKFGNPYCSLLNINLHSVVFEQLALAQLNIVRPENFHCSEMCFLSFRIFEQLAFALKNRVALHFSLH